MKLCGSRESEFQDALGPTYNGGPNARAQVSNQLFGPNWEGGNYNRAQAYGDQAASGWSRAATLFGRGANSPTLASADRQLSKTLGGQYLTSNPALDKYDRDQSQALDTGLAATRRASEAGLAGQIADQQAAFGRNGMTWSTGQTQGAQATQAALASHLADAEAAARSQLAAQQSGQRAQVYTQERGNQMQAASMAPQVAAAPGTIQSQAGQAGDKAAASMITPSEQTANVIRNLWSGGTTNTYQKPGAFDYAAQLGGIAAMAGY